MKKILCVCDEGNIRSASLKYILWRQRFVYPNEAIAIGYNSTGEETKAILFTWADLIVDLSTEGFRDEHKGSKYLRYPLGKDIWNNPLHPELLEKLYPLVKEIKMTQ